MEPAGTPHPRQTLSYLADLFRKHGLTLKKKLGQNFLIDLNLLEVIVGVAELSREDLVVEIGTGTGSLTARLAAEAGAVLSVEIDPAFHDLARQTLGERSNIRLVHADILKNKNHLNPQVLDALAELRGRFPLTPTPLPRGERGWGEGPRIKLVANLPYVVATPVIGNFLALDLPLERMVVTVQWELAERLWARPGTKAYGALAVLVQSVADVKLVRKLPPSVFWPRPQIESAIVLIQPNAERRARAPELTRLRPFLRDLYAHRRKNLRGALAAMPDRPDKKTVDRKLAELGLDGSLRAETLPIEDHWRLCAAFI